MCLILFSYKNHPKYRLILAANRDEFLDRPTKPARFWNEHPDLLAGKDTRAGGTWMGVTTDLRFAAITNYREPASEKPDAPSRGHLVLDYLKGSSHPQAYLQELQKNAAVYNGYNLLAGSAAGLWFYSNKENQVREVTPGIHGLSNHLLDTPWPKVQKGKERLGKSITSQTLQPGTLIDLLGDSEQAPDHLLPNTGVPQDWERLLSPMFIRAPNYGTRASTVLLIDHEGKVTFVERTIGKGNKKQNEVTYSFPAGFG